MTVYKRNLITDINGESECQPFGGGFECQWQHKLHSFIFGFVDYYCNNNHTVKFFSVKLYLEERFLSDLTPKLV